MHTQMKRLYQAAEALKKIKGQSDVARALNASPQTINNWEARGMSKAGMLTAQNVLGCSATWLDTGTGPMEIGASDTTDQIVAVEQDYGLQWISSEEYKLLTRYRGADQDGKSKIMRIAEQMPKKLLNRIISNDQA